MNAFLKVFQGDSGLSVFFRHLERVLAILLVASLCAPVRATTPPQPGNQFPKPFLDFKKDHPHLFKSRGGLESMADRAHKERVSQGKPAPGGGSLTSPGVVSGTVSIPIILALFNNTPAPPYPPATLQNILFNGPNPTGTMTNYYSEISYGNLNLTGTVFNWVTLPQNDTFYEGGNNGLPPGGQPGQFVLDALTLADPAVNFSLFDNDGPDGNPNSGDDDGFVDFVALVHPESGGECIASTNMWSHRWTLQAAAGQEFATNDPAAGGGFIRINNYTIQPALRCDGVNPIEIGVFCHEFGHSFGLPDLYDTDNSSGGLGSWSLMAAGNWNSPSKPAHMDPWSKCFLGWILPSLVASAGDVPTMLSVPQVETNPVAYRIAINANQYFLIENRQAVGFDQNLKTCGLAVYHIDEGTIASWLTSNTVNNRENCTVCSANPPAHYGIALEQADAGCHLECNTNRGDAGDLFPGSSNNTAFGPATVPSSADYNGANTNISLTNISACGANMTVDVSAPPLPPFTPTPVDVVFLMDVTESYADDLPNIVPVIPGVVAQLAGAFPDIRFGLASFRDFPFSTFGSTGDAAYVVNQTLTANQTDFINAVNALTAAGGNDAPESQYEALYQVLTGAGQDLTGNGIPGDEPGEIAPSGIGWMAGRARVIYLVTDSSFHNSDTENYPGTTLKAAGRSDVLALLAPNDPTILLILADNPGAFITQGEAGSIPNLPQTELAVQAEELAITTLGGTFPAGTNSADIRAAVETTVGALEGSDLPLFGAVALDIKPGSCPNPLNVLERGLVPTAILGTTDFDVTKVDPGSVRLAGVPPVRGSIEDVGSPPGLRKGKTDCATDCAAQGPDGIVDLLLKFDARSLVAALGPVNNRQCIAIQVTGMLKPEFLSTPILGEDSVLILKRTPGGGAQEIAFEWIFIRGDTNGDGEVDMSDPMSTLHYLFIEGTGSPVCLKAADSNDDGQIDLSDAIKTLSRLFLDTMPLPPPFPGCAFDPSPDELSCRESEICEGL